MYDLNFNSSSVIASRESSRSSQFSQLPPSRQISSQLINYDRDSRSTPFPPKNKIYPQFNTPAPLNPDHFSTMSENEIRTPMYVDDDRSWTTKKRSSQKQTPKGLFGTEPRNLSMKSRDLQMNPLSRLNGLGGSFQYLPSVPEASNEYESMPVV